jgi:iron complex outermembrane recepter protein
MKKWKWLVAIGVFFSLTGSGPVGAEEDKPLTEKLDDIVVTATRTEKSISSAPGSVSVVTRGDMDKRNIKTLDEALNTTVGVFDDSKGKGLMGTTSSVSMRGMGYDKRVLFLLDGYLPLNDGYTGGVSYQMMPMEDVERIEVVRGPFSSLYGGNAMAGVVNVQTKMPEKRELTFKTGYGSGWSRGDALDDLKKFYFSYGDKFNDNIHVLASYGRKDTNGYPTGLNIQSSKPTAGITGYETTTDTKGSTRYLIGDTGDNTWWDDQITLKTGFDFSSTSKLNLSFIRSRYKYGYDDPHTYLKDAKGNDVWKYGSVNESSFLSGDGGVEQNIYGISYDTQFSSVKTKASFGYMDRTTSWYVTRGSTSATTQNGGPGTLSDTPSAGYNGDLQFTVPMFDRHILTFGTTYRAEWAHTEEDALSNWSNESTRTQMTYEAKGNARTFSLYAQDEIAVLDSLTAYLGCREDWWRTSDGYANSVGSAGYPKTYDSRDADSFSPKGALVYKPFDETTFRTSVGKAFRAPSVYDLYRTWTSSTGVTYQANPDLKPETVITWDAGVEQGLWKGMKVKGTYFENYMTDLIYRQTVSSTLQKNINAGKAESKGIELEAEQRFDFGLKLFANYTYTNAILKENQANPATVGKKLIGVPENMFNAGGSYTIGPVTASLTGRYIGKRYGSDDNSDEVNHVFTSYDPYFTADAKVSYKFAKYAELSLSADNIFGENYYGYYPGLGSAWFAELTLRY